MALCDSYSYANVNKLTPFQVNFQSLPTKFKLLASNSFTLDIIQPCSKLGTIKYKWVLVINIGAGAVRFSFIYHHSVYIVFIYSVPSAKACPNWKWKIEIEYMYIYICSKYIKNYLLATLLKKQDQDVTRYFKSKNHPNLIIIIIVMVVFIQKSDLTPI